MADDHTILTESNVKLIAAIELHIRETPPSATTAAPTKPPEVVIQWSSDHTCWESVVEGIRFTGATPCDVAAKMQRSVLWAITAVAEYLPGGFAAMMANSSVLFGTGRMLATINSAHERAHIAQAELRHAQDNQALN